MPVDLDDSVPFSTAGTPLLCGRCVDVDAPVPNGRTASPLPVGSANPDVAFV